MRIVHCPICGPKASARIKYDANFDPSALDFTARKRSKHMHFRILECNGCNLVYSSPIVEDMAILDLYERADFISEPHLNNMINDYVMEFGKVLHLAAGRERLLEVGCANGLFLDRVRDFGFKEIWGVEPGRKAFEAAPEEVRCLIKNDFLKSGMFEPNYFDIICSFQVFDHIIDPNAFLELIYSYLKPGGILLQLHHDIRSPLPTILGSRATTYDVEHIYLWDQRTVRLILARNGFDPLILRRTWNAYQIEHILLQLPLPGAIKSFAEKTARMMMLANLNIRVPVENMLVVSRKV